MAEINLDILGKIELGGQLREIADELEKIDKLAKTTNKNISDAFAIQGEPEKKIGAMNTALTEQDKIVKQLASDLERAFASDLGNKQTQNIKDINEGLKKTGDTAKKTLTDMKAIEAEAKKLLKTVADNTGNLEAQSKAIQDFVNQLEPEQAQAFFAGVNDGLDEFANKVETPKQRLRELKTLLSQMDESSPEFQALAIEAAQLEDKIGDVSARIRNLASDTKNIDALISAAEGITGGFAIAQGAIGLFGDESEDLNKTLLKVQSAMAILNGLQAVQKTLLEESAAKSVLFANAQKLIALATGQATGAAKAFRLALLSTGVGALLVGLGALIANFDKVKSAIFGGVSPATIKLTEDQKKLADETNRVVDSFARQALEMKLAGDTEEFIQAKRVSDLNAQIEANKKLVDLEQQKLKELKSQGQVVNTGLGFVTVVGEASQEELDQVKKDIADYEEIVANAEFELLQITAENIDKKNEQYFREQEEAKKNKEEATRIRKEKIEEQKRLDKEEADRQRDFNESIAALYRQQDEAYLNSLTGADQIAAETAAADERISILEDSLKSELDKLKLSGEEKANQVQAIEEAITELRLSNVQESEKKLRDLRLQESEKNLAFEEQIALNEIRVKIAGQRSVFETEEDYQKELNNQLLAAQLGFAEQRLNALQNAVGLEAEAARSEIEATIADLKLKIEDLNKSAPDVGGIDGFVKKIFGLDDQGLAELKAGAEFALENVQNLLNEVFQSQLANSQAVIDSLDEQIAAQEEAVQTQSDLKEQGLANDLDAEKRALEELNLQRKKAAEEQAKIRKIQAGIEVAQQLGALGVAAAQMYASQAPKGLIGVGLAAGAIATILAFMAKLKATAGNSIIKARTGRAEILKGNSHDAKGPDGIPGVRLGHIEAEGGEALGIIRKDAPESQKLAFLKLAEDINSGTLRKKFPPANLPFASSLRDIQRQQRQERHTIERENIELKKELRSLNDKVDALLSELRNRPSYWREDDGSVVKRGEKTTRYKKDNK